MMFPLVPPVPLPAVDFPASYSPAAAGVVVAAVVVDRDRRQVDFNVCRRICWDFEFGLLLFLPAENGIICGFQLCRADLLVSGFHCFEHAAVQFDPSAGSFVQMKIEAQLLVALLHCRQVGIERQSKNVVSGGHGCRQESRLMRNTCDDPEALWKAAAGGAATSVSAGRLRSSFESGSRSRSSVDSIDTQYRLRKSAGRFEVEIRSQSLSTQIEMRNPL